MSQVNLTSIQSFLVQLNECNLNENLKNLNTDEKKFITRCIDAIQSAGKKKQARNLNERTFNRQVQCILGKLQGSPLMPSPPSPATASDTRAGNESDAAIIVKVKEVTDNKKMADSSVKPSAAPHSLSLVGTIQRFFQSIGESLSSAWRVLTFQKSRKAEATALLATDQNNTIQAVNEAAKPILQQAAPYHLLEGDKPISPSQFAWHLNLGLLREAYASTDDPVLKKQIQFLATNYLDKTAPIRAEHTRKYVRNFDTTFQTGPYSNYDSYHRLAFTEKMKRLDQAVEYSKEFGLGEKAPLILVDTVEFQHLLPVGLHVMNEKPEKWSDSLTAILSAHFTKHGTVAKGLTKSFEKNILFDLTEQLKSSIKTEGKEENEQEFNKNLNELKKQMNDAIERSLQDLAKKFPDLTNDQKAKIKRAIYKHTNGIARVQVNDQIGGIKILPIFSSELSLSNLRKTHGRLLEFIDHSGIFLGAVNMRRHIMKGFAIRKDVHYAVKGKDAFYYPTVSDFTNTALMKRLSEKFSSETFKTEKPHVAILGDATVKLVKGLLENISEEQWNTINADPARQKIVQTTLFQLREQLATAELHMNDYIKFAQAIELAQCEIATLLEMTYPFKAGDFSDIYKQQLDSVVPPPLKPLLKATLGKTAVNTFAGINAALLQNHPHPTTCYSKGLYYEEAGLMGDNYRFEDMINNDKITRIDLYAAQVNPNIEVVPEHTHYECVDIAANVRKILDKKPDTKHLTVAVDCTIDYLHSPKIRELLTQFEKDIKDGRVNFVFFHSGQKFDMLGMDNYFGSPFYLVNNGDPHWQPFNDMVSKQVHKTDLLSEQWFCLSHKYAATLIDDYRRTIFNNAKDILKHVPDVLKPNGKKSQKIWISTIDKEMEPSFIDIKINGSNNKELSKKLIARFYEKCTDSGVKVFKKPSFGFYHPNLVYIPGSSDSMSIRINPSLNPEENKVIIEFLNELVALQSD
ncbi:hypothetical protein [Candidatus Protochlamydia phocaeensis]|uniref:hypothetical protein n=1 Tax=Candidatus Protochlamydia phocaeensis TaxID=1414722 RepID=UPI0008386EFD|nr:hypothetical protein [Candidatus Protochlamydia phocaeensis]